MFSRKIRAYVGILAVAHTGVAIATGARPGDFIMHSRNSISMEGSPATLPVVPDISRVSYEDFDATPYLSQLSFGGEVFSGTRKRIRTAHLHTNVPYIDVAHPYVDYEGLEAIPFFIAQCLKGKVHPSICTGAKEFFEKIIVPNQRKLGCRAREIPDLDCLYYKDVLGEQHLFLRLSSKTRRRAEKFKKRANEKSVLVEDGDAEFFAGENMELDHQNIEANNVRCKSKKIRNRASKTKAKWCIQLAADDLQNETIINKTGKYEGNSEKGSYVETVSSVDDCSFSAQRVIHAGELAKNFGILVDAREFCDFMYQTINMPAKITLYSRAWEEKNGLFSSSSTRINREDDVLVPNRYHVDFYRSKNPKSGSSVKFGYTLIDAGSKIEIEKDTKEDVAVDERHVIEIHEEKNGFSIFGGVSVPDPTAMLQKLSFTQESKDMKRLSLETLNAAAKGIQMLEDYKNLHTLLTSGNSWTSDATTSLLQTLSHFANGSSLQFSTRSADIKQSTKISHGNTFIAPEHTYNNRKKSVFAGDYFGKYVRINTKTFVTLDLPQTTDYEMSVHQTGVNMDLLTFATSLLTPQISGALGAALAASSVSVSCQSNRMHVEEHRPTTIYAQKQIDINAKYGHLTQAQIKAGIVHAVFSDNVTLKSLKNEKWTVQSGNSFSFSLGSIVNFENLAATIKDVVRSTTISHVDSGELDRVIDCFASLVGEKEFYLKVGKVLETKSALFGHVNHDPKHEHMDVKTHRNTEEKQEHKSWDRSWDLSLGAVVDFADSLTPKNKQKRDPLADVNLEELPPENESPKTKNIEPKTTKIPKKQGKTSSKQSQNPKKDKPEQSQALSGLNLEYHLQQPEKSKYFNLEHQYAPEQMLNLQHLREDQLVQKAINDQPKTIIGKAEAACKLVAEDIGNSIRKTNSLSCREYIESKRAELPDYARNNPEVLAKFGMGQAICKGYAKAGEGIAAVLEKADDLTGNVVSKGVYWTAQKFENFCNTAENAAGNFVQKAGGSETAVNYAKDSVRVGLKVTKEAVKLAAAGGVAKGVTCATAKTASTVGKVANKVGSQVKRVINKNVVNQKIAEAAAINKSPYTPRKAQGLAENLLGSNEFTRSTIPGQSMPNVRLAGQCKERVIIDPVTKEKITQRVVFDQRGFPQFDPYVKVETRITGDLSSMERAAHMKLATQQLKRDIIAGKLDPALFSKKQLSDIMNEEARIKGFVWHHHQETGRMQLVPKDIHEWVKHIGGDRLWGMLR